MSASTEQTSAGRLASVRRRLEPHMSTLQGSDTAKAAGLAVAMIANNLLALVATIVFARLLNDYGSLGALISYLLILTVAGLAMQVAVAREGALGHLGRGRALVATTTNWTRSLLFVTAVLTILSVLFRNPIASAVGVDRVVVDHHVHHYAWAAALGIPAGCMYLEVCLLRGALQGVADYKSVGFSLVGEQAVRLVAGAALAVGLGVTGAYLGSIISYVAMAVYCAVQLRKYAVSYVAPVGEPVSRPRVSLEGLVWGAMAPIAGLAVIAVLQNIDIIAAKHRFTAHTATSYAAVAVAAKVLIWVAIGAGFYLVPEVSRRHAEGKDTRPVLFRALGIILVAALPCLLIFAFGSHLLISSVFGAKKATASASLLPLGAAFTVLSLTYLAVQYMLALKRTWFLIALGAVAIAEPVLLLQASRRPAGFATVVLAIQAMGALLAFTFALRPAKAPPAAPSPAGPLEDSFTSDPARDRVAAEQLPGGGADGGHQDHRAGRQLEYEL
jgi:O-antigen/teichoic acid export membrane protein